MIKQSRTFVNKRGLIPKTSKEAELNDYYKIPARIYVAKHSRSTEEMIEFLGMLGLI